MKEAPLQYLPKMQQFWDDFREFLQWSWDYYRELFASLVLHLRRFWRTYTVRAPFQAFHAEGDLPQVSMERRPKAGHEAAHDPQPEEEPTPASQKSASMADAACLFLGDKLIFHADQGVIDFVHAGVPVIERAGAWVEYRQDRKQRTVRLDAGAFSYRVHDNGLTITQNDADLLLTWHIALEPSLELWLELRNIGSAPLHLERMCVLDLPAEKGGRLFLGTAPRRWSIYQNGWASWSPAFARHLQGSIHVIPDSEPYALYHLPHGNPDSEGVIASEWMSLLWGRGAANRPAAAGLLAGFVSGADFLSEIRLQGSADAFEGLQALCYADGIALAPEETLLSERLLLDAGPDPLALLEQYAGRVAEVMRARPSAPAIPHGWCSWYYFFGENTAQDVRDNLEEMQEENLPIDYVLIDDGYPRAIGDWLTPDAAKFQDMAELARAIHSEGRRAGIWVAPFGLDPGSAAYHVHPDWVVRDELGNPVVGWRHCGRDIYALDTTHPEVTPWLASIFRTMREEWGFDLFKVDFLFAGASQGRRHNPNATRAQALRAGLEIIRQAIGEEAFLLGSGAPLLPCVGMVDGMRVGPDVAGNWHPSRPDLSMPAAENALRNSIARSFTHGRWWIIDPGAVLLREREDRSDLNLNEVRTLASVVALLGGITMEGDNLTTLRKGRLKYWEQILPPTGISALPLDLFEHELPECLALPVRRPWGEWLVIAAINWDDRLHSTELDLLALGLPAGRYHVFNYWPGRYMGTAESIITLDRHMPHETVVLLLKPVVDEPDILTTTFHVAQALQEVAGLERERGEDGRILLRVLLEHPREQFGELWFTFPPSLRIESVKVNGNKRKVSSDSVGVAHLGFTLKRSGRVDILFEPVEGAGGG